ncbi:MAG TPA: methionine--tRNA ligase [Patescibacteria group bacterium]|nr:methionine--tRNA ligase [Patescibacteria group bacterium]
MSKPKFYMTTAIAYTSRVPHIGNTYEAVVSDAIARFKRMTGYEVFFLTGTDEHGQKIQQQAIEDGLTPKQHVDKIAGEIKRIWDFMNVSYDKFIRTTDKEHIETVQKIFRKLYDQGDIYKSSYEGWYCTPCESFYTETQLVDGKCPDCGREVQKASEEAYFFKLSKYADRLVKHIEENPNFIWPEARKNEMINNFIKPGLQDLCVSRTSFDWGVPVSFDDKHVVYVWIDALSNYITALGYDPDGQSGELYKKYWPADVHIIGKDIVRFHTIYWPIILMALGEELPKQVYGHPWLLQGKDKMSKSRGNVIYAEDLVKYFGLDPVRYYLLKEMPFAQDGNMTYEHMIGKINSDLANNLGNLVNRTITMVDKYFGGIVAEPGVKEPIDDELINLALETPSKVEEKMNEYRVAEALDEVITLLKRSNKYIDETQPWVLAKDEAGKDRLATVLYNLLESIRIASVLLVPFIPDTAVEIQRQLNASKTDWESIKSFNGTVAGNKVNDAKPLFARIDEAKKLAEINAALEAEAPAEQSKVEEKIENKKEQSKKEDAPVSDGFITIDDFAKVQLKVAKVLECEKVEKSDKLLKLQLEVGEEKRQVVSGIAKTYKPEDLIGKYVILVANLKPVKLRGIESNGMILAAVDDNTLTLVTPMGEIKSGADVS